MRRLLVLALCLAVGACAHGVTLDPSARPDLPEPPADLAPCLRATFPEIPETGFGSRRAALIIADAKLLDRAKTACGERALSWIEDVRREFGKPTP